MKTNTTFSVLIPFTDKMPTKWHPRTIKTLVRGCFDSVDECHAWAAAHLMSFHRYTIGCYPAE